MGGMGGVVDINIIAVLEVMKLKRVKNLDECLEKVQLISGKVISEQRRSKGENENR